jgi:hypothetical protein
VADLPSARDVQVAVLWTSPFKQGFQAPDRADNPGKSLAVSLNLRGFFLKLLR